MSPAAKMRVLSLLLKMVLMRLISMAVLFVVISAAPLLLLLIVRSVVVAVWEDWEVALVKAAAGHRVERQEQMQQASLVCSPDSDSSAIGFGESLSRHQSKKLR